MSERNHLNESGVESVNCAEAMSERNHLNESGVESVNCAEAMSERKTHGARCQIGATAPSLSQRWS